MGTSYEYYKKAHPDEFSDSEIIRASKLDRDFFDFYLNSLTSRGEEKKFEIFCRRIAEKEICPNLLPQTGPTGGGDSKVDSETYPVSDQLPVVLYSGVGVKASRERWAFAFSAKQKWKDKLYSDIEKIVDIDSQTGRGYKKIFFISSQYISDRNRAKEEDTLRQKYEIDIRILDRNWLLEMAFSKGLVDIAVDCFELSDTFTNEIKKGPGDYSKEQKLQDIEDKIKNFDPASPKASLIPLALEAAYISRSLENLKDVTMEKFERVLRIINEFGLPAHKTECIYEWAWTLHWWYEDYDGFYKKYCEYEELAVSSDNIYEIERLSNLWMNLRTWSFTNQDLNIKPHSIRLQEALEQFINDKSRPHTAFEAHAIMLNVSFMFKDNPEDLNIDDLVRKYIDLIKNSDKHLDFSLLTLSKIITGIPFLEDSKHYDEMFELLTTKLAERSEETTRAKLLVGRAMKIAEEKPITAITYLGRSLIDLYKEESKHELIIALYGMGVCLEDIGCFWAARNYQLYVLSLCLTQYKKYGEIHPVIVRSSDALATLELRLGRIGYSLFAHEWSVISENLFRSERSDYKKNKDLDMFEVFMAIAIMKIPFEKLSNTESLMVVLIRQDLYHAEVALKYMLGHYDEDYLKYSNNSISEFDRNMNQIYFQPFNEQILYTPWFGMEETAVLQSRVLGCNIVIESENKYICLELGATILALLESFFATGVKRTILIQNDTIKIGLSYFSDKEFSIKLLEHATPGMDISIMCSDYDKDDFVGSQKSTGDFLEAIFPEILAKMVYFSASKDQIEELIKEEKAFDRAFSFCDSIFIPAQVFGDDYGISAYDNSGHENKIDNPCKLIRTSPVSFVSTSDEVFSKEDDNSKKKIVYGEPPADFNLEKINHQQMAVASIIDIPLWENAKWRGILVIASPINEFTPMLGLTFANITPAQQIFSKWRDRFGNYDAEDEIQIGIIKGIDKNNPYYYRVIITSNIDHNIAQKQNKHIQCICRLNTMEAMSLDNLHKFESAIKQNEWFMMMPSIMNAGQPEPEFDLAIRKNVKSVTIRNAWEIEEGSYLFAGLMPSDDPIIPPGFGDAPIVNVMRYKSKLPSNKPGRNDPCPCGSGKKYKKCCGNSTE